TTARTRVQAGAARGLTPLVGRDAEIDVFKQLVQRVSVGRGQMLAMVGEPGVGKSRLVHEFTRHRLPHGWLVLEGASGAYGKAKRYLPISEMLRRCLCIHAGEGNENIRSQIVRHVLELDSTLKGVIAPIFSLLGVSPDEKAGVHDQQRDRLASEQDLAE